MTTYYKAVRPDGASFHDPSFRWLPGDGTIPADGFLVEHPRPARHFGPRSQTSASCYLSLSVAEADCTGFSWPCRLLVVEPAGVVWEDDCYQNKRRVLAARVVGEVEPWRAFGPNGREVVAFLELLPTLSDAARAAARDAARAAARAAALAAARAAALAAARDAARDAARAALWAVARDAAWDAAWDAALALLVRDLISAEHFATLTAPMRAAGVNFDALVVTA